MDQEYPGIFKPVSKARFLADHWEQTPLHIERSDREYYRGLLSIEDIESLLSTGGQFFPEVQLVNAVADVPLVDYTDDTRQIIAPGLWGHFRDGATLVVSAAERKFSTLTDLCRSVSTELCMRSQANVYLSPAGCQGFRPHYDTHDVFVLQLSGSKLFRFFPSDTELPFTEHSFPPDYPVNDAIEEEVLLSAGDTLYIPRGVVHDAVAQGDDPSLHITLGVFPIVVRDLLQEAVQVLAEREVGLRRTVALQLPVTDSVLQQFGAVIDQSALNEARSRLLDEVVVGITPSSGNLHTNVTIDQSSRMAFDKRAVIGVEKCKSLVKLRVAGQVLEFPEPYAAAVLRLIENESMSLNDLAGLDRDQYSALVDQLRRAGCLHFVLDS